ncbi:MAG TPA: hypothetical protein VMB21_19205 [Candidatus Limnocylindria bacterium]|jgi:hypothetical protein|nr:hypothetical protein [Candidatus Limnocylindria bacterium]
MNHIKHLFLASSVLLCILNSTAQTFGFNASTSNNGSDPFRVNGSDVPIPITGTFSGSTTIDPSTGTVSLLGSLTEAAGNASVSFTQTLTKTVFIHNPFPNPGGITVTNKYTDILQLSVSYGAFSQPVSASSVTPVYVAGNTYEVPLTFSGTLPVSLSYSLTENGTFVEGRTVNFKYDVSLRAYLDTTGYPSSVTVTPQVDHLFIGVSGDFEVVAPSGNTFAVSAVPEPTEYGIVFGVASIGIGICMRRRRQALLKA